ncbi:hypothetical protein LXL04_010655 [Taraxacum kok-saghyz]
MECGYNSCNFARLLSSIGNSPQRLWNVKQMLSTSACPPQTNKAKRGISTQSDRCTRCNLYVETPDHVLVECPAARTTWSWIWRWCDLPENNFNTIEETINYAANWGKCVKKMRILISICYDTLWWIWKARNENVFKKLCIPPTTVADNIQSMVYIWIKHRSSIKAKNWAECCSNPLT